MELVNELGNELVLAFLVEKKHADKIDLKNALALISEIQDTLEAVSEAEPAPGNTKESLNAAINNSNASAA